jgi:hypothetical protein
MKIYKYNQFINEDNYQDTPEEYVNTALLKLKKKIDSFFEKPAEENQNPQEKPKNRNMDQAKQKGKERKKDESKMSFQDLNVNLESSELSKYSAQFDSIKIIFSDPEFRYDLFITIPLEEGINKDKTKDFSDKEIKKCSYKFKKYDLDGFELIGQIGPKTIEIDKIDEEFLVSLKIELDDEYGEGEEELEFET